MPTSISRGVWMLSGVASQKLLVLVVIVPAAWSMAVSSALRGIGPRAAASWVAARLLVNSLCPGARPV